MKTLISIPVAISLVLLTALLWMELQLNPEDQFGNKTVAATVALASVIILGLVSLWLLRKHKKLVEGLWLSLWSIALAYLAADFLAGQLFLRELSPPMIHDESVHHKLIPGTLTEFKNREFHYIQRVNHVGLRGEDFNVEKAVDTYRILMLGDSFTNGRGVRDDETFSALLDESLSTAGRKVQVLNAGVDSYSPILSYRQLATNFGALLDPDLVVLNFDMSDLMQEVAYREISVKTKSGEIIGFPPSGVWKTKIERAINNNFYFTRIVFIYLDRWSGRGNDNVTVENMVTLANPGLLRHTLADDDADRAEQWQNIFASILKIRNYCHDRNIRFLLTVYPWGHQVSNDEWTSGRYGFLEKEFSISDRSIVGLKAFADSHSMKFLNTFPAFRSYDGASPLYFDFDMHWTATGHQIMSDELHRYISDTFLGGHDE